MVFPTPKPGLVVTRGDRYFKLRLALLVVNTCCFSALSGGVLTGPDPGSRLQPEVPDTALRGCPCRAHLHCSGTGTSSGSIPRPCQAPDYYTRSQHQSGEKCSRAQVEAMKGVKVRCQIKCSCAINQPSPEGGLSGRTQRNNCGSSLKRSREGTSRGIVQAYLISWKTQRASLASEN